MPKGGGFTAHSDKASARESECLWGAFQLYENRPCCINCGEEVYVPKLEDRNSAARKFAFNQSLEKIRNKFDSNGGKS